MGDFGFPKRSRLLDAREFERVFAARHSAASPGFAMYGAANELGHARLGITVSRRTGNAVERNRWKRVLREAFRLSQSRLPAIDFVCVVRSPAPPPLTTLSETLLELAARVSRKIDKSANKA
jgi:ribonuclease P protein component